MSKKRKLTEVELKVKKHILPEVNHAYQKTISYSQFSFYQQCPHKWYLSYVDGKKQEDSNIYTVFGTAIHETIQHFINTMYSISGAEADRLDLESYFQERLAFNYSEEYKKMKFHFSNPEEINEFYEDGIAILHWIQKRRNKLFTTRKVRLIGIEIPIMVGVANNIFLRGFIDFVLYDEDLDKVTIYDIKTSTRGWGDYAKKDEIKISQILIYKQYFAQQFDVDIDKIDVEYFIVRRKLYENMEFPIPRVQKFIPPSGKNKRGKVMENLNKFIKEAFDSTGQPIVKEYPKIASESNCKFCPFNNLPDLCNKM